MATSSTTSSTLGSAGRIRAAAGASRAITVHMAVGGSANVVVAKHPSENRLQPLLTFIDEHGNEVVIALSTPDVVNVMASLVTLFSAEQELISRWWEQLRASG